MQQRKATLGLGRPSGTDGSDYSYRMVVDSRCQLVAKGKQRSASLFYLAFTLQLTISVLITQVKESSNSGNLSFCKPGVTLFLLIGMIFAVSPGIEKDTPNTVAFSSIIVSSVSLVIVEIGRRRSRASLLRLCAVVSSIAMVLLFLSLAKWYSLLKASRDYSFLGTRKFDVDDFPGFQAGLLLYIFTLSLFKIFTIKAVVSLLFNMSPPKKAS